MAHDSRLMAHGQAAGSPGHDPWAMSHEPWTIVHGPMNGLAGQLVARRPQVALPRRLPMEYNLHGLNLLINKITQLINGIN